MKVCCRCKVLKGLLEFYKNRARGDGLSHICKACTKEIKKSPRGIANSRASNNNAKGHARARKYSQTAKGRAALKRKRYKYRSSEKGREANRRAKRKHYWLDPDHQKAKAIARFHGVTVELLDKVRNRDKICRLCGAKDGLVFDHIYPRVLGGRSTEANLQLLCNPCNSWKRHNLLLPGGGLMIINLKDVKC